MRPQKQTKEDAARAAANAYKREWARKNPEKVKAAQLRYWAKKAREMQEAEADGNEGNTAGS